MNQFTSTLRNTPTASWKAAENFFDIKGLGTKFTYLSNSPPKIITPLDEKCTFATVMHVIALVFLSLITVIILISREVQRASLESKSTVEQKSINTNTFVQTVMRTTSGDDSKFLPILRALKQMTPDKRAGEYQDFIDWLINICSTTTGGGGGGGGGGDHELSNFFHANTLTVNITTLE